MTRSTPWRGPIFHTVALSAALLFLFGVPLDTASVPANPFAAQGAQAAGLPQIRTVNAPRFTGAVAANQAAVFWFGAVSPSSNYSDVRVGYTDTELYVYVSTFDRLLWYNTINPQQDLIAWDTDTLYLSLNGPTGGAPDARTYRFDAELSNNPAGNPAAYQASYRGNGAGWAAAPLAFTTVPGWRGTGGINSAQDNRGWAMTYHIPFSSLGLSGPPAPGAAWALGLVNHDRDSASGPPVGDTPWPEGLAPTVPASWGRLVFGLPTYLPPTTTNNQAITIQHKLNNVTVPDADVGGYTNCGDGLDFWSQWGYKNYFGLTDFNVQNQSDIADFPCYAKYYVTFPLSSLPQGRAIASATLTLHQFGGSGAAGQATPSLIQVSTVRNDWSEASITWNNAPYALENVGQASVAPLASQPPWPGVARTWDLSRAVADAFASGQPLRLAIYSADTDYHSGKYFVGSDTGDWNAAGRPTLSVVVGTQGPTVPPLPAPRPGGGVVGSPDPLPGPRGTTGTAGGPAPNRLPVPRP